MSDLTIWDERFLRLAQHVSTWSKDPSTKVGAVIADGKNRIVSLGYNGFPRGIADTSERLTDRETKYRLVVHAERNAILFASRSLSACTLFTWPFMPCSQCAAMVIQAGVSKVVAPSYSPARWYVDHNLAHTMFKEANVELVLRHFSELENHP